MLQRKKYEEVADLLLARVRAGEFQPGDRLPAERVLAQEYQVSRSVIREAVRAMEQLGCVESRVGGGSYVRIPDSSNIADPFSIIFEQDRRFARDFIETRLILEPQIARLAALHRTEAQLNAMTQTLADMETALRLGQRGEAQDALFHKQMAQASGNQALALLISTLSEVMSRSLRITQQMDGVPPQALQDHRRILEAVRAQKGSDAELRMRKHLICTQENLNKLLE